MAMIGATYNSADAQVKDEKSLVCRKSSGTAVSCYVTEYAENFKVCKGDNGYTICGETPDANNSTQSRLPAIAADRSNQTQYKRSSYPTGNTQQGMLAPQSQSYPADYTTNSSSSYDSYFPAKGRMKFCKNTNNVADANQAPYKGCPSPQYDGPEKNRARNINVSNPEPEPSIDGGK